MNKEILDRKDNSAVQAHINMLQGMINRMATNSANCKTWAITILAALLVLIVDEKICFNTIWICYIPIVLFFFLDCFYLGLERHIIKKQELFIEKINSNKDYSKDLFTVKSNVTNTFWEIICLSGETFFRQLWDTFKGIFSFSTFPFYGFMISFIYYLSK
jgi:hypothetical protein